MESNRHSGTPDRREGGNLLPEGWAFTSIENCIAEDGLISDGDWVESKDQDPTGSVRLIQLADVGDGIFRDKSERFMTPESASRLNCTYLKAGDVLVARMPDPLGRACIFPGVSNECVTVVDVCLVRTTSNSAILNTVLKYWINTPSFRAKIAENASGTTRKRITRKKLEKFEIPLPPLAEQKVIAEKLDTLLAQVDTTKARLERIPDIIKRFRQSVLAAAVSGKLTVVEETELKTVNEVCTSAFDGPFGSKLKSADYTDFGVRVSRLENIGHLLFDNEKKTYISEDKYSTLTKNTLLLGDVLFSSFVDEEVKVCVFDVADEIFINKADCFCLRPDSNKVDSRYLSYVLASSTSYKQIKNEVQGVTRPRINLRILKSLEFNFPRIKEQTEIVRRVEELFSFADTIEKKAAAALERVNNLTQSILAKAFRGELTADWRAANPELINGDNSAEALLAKIQAEREALKPVKKTRKKKAEA